MSRCARPPRAYCPNDCHGRGECDLGFCACKPPYYGVDCSLAPPPPPASGLVPSRAAPLGWEEQGALRIPPAALVPSGGGGGRRGGGGGEGCQPPCVFVYELPARMNVLSSRGGVGGAGRGPRHSDAVIRCSPSRRSPAGRTTRTGDHDPPLHPPLHPPSSPERRPRGRREEAPDAPPPGLRTTAPSRRCTSRCSARATAPPTRGHSPSLPLPPSTPPPLHPSTPPALAQAGGLLLRAHLGPARLVGQPRGLPARPPVRRDALPVLERVSWRRRLLHRRSDAAEGGLTRRHSVALRRRPHLHCHARRGGLLHPVGLTMGAPPLLDRPLQLGRRHRPTPRPGPTAACGRPLFTASAREQASPESRPSAASTRGRAAACRACSTPRDPPRGGRDGPSVGATSPCQECSRRTSPPSRR